MHSHIVQKYFPSRPEVQPFRLKAIFLHDLLLWTLMSQPSIKGEAAPSPKGAPTIKYPAKAKPSPRGSTKAKPSPKGKAKPSPPVAPNAPAAKVTGPNAEYHAALNAALNTIKREFPGIDRQPPLPLASQGGDPGAATGMDLWGFKNLVGFAAPFDPSQFDAQANWGAPSNYNSHAARARRWRRAGGAKSRLPRQ
jgi:hypothetical protein